MVTGHVVGSVHGDGSRDQYMGTGHVVGSVHGDGSRCRISTW